MPKIGNDSNVTGSGTDTAIDLFKSSNEPQWSYAALLIIPIFTIWGNILVCLSVRLEKRLQNRFNYFLVSLAMSDLLCAVLVMPVSAWKMIKGGDIPHVPREFCLAWYSLDVFFTASTIIHLCTISIDRYFALNNPLRYHSTKRKSSLIIKIFIAWLVPFCIACPLFIFALRLDHEDHALSFKGCGPHNVYFILTATGVTFVLPFIIMVVTYVLTISTIIRQTRRAQTNLHARSFKPVVVFRREQESLNNCDVYKVNRERHMSTTSFIHSSKASTEEDETFQQDITADANMIQNAFGFFKYKGRIKKPLSTPATPTPMSKEISCVNRLTPPVHLSNRQSLVPKVEIDGPSCASIIGVFSNNYPHDNPININKITRNYLSVPDHLEHSCHGISSTRRSSAASTIRHAVDSVYSTYRRRKPSKTTDYIQKGKKAVQVLGILFVLFILCYLPFFVIYLLDFFCVSCGTTTNNLVAKMEWIGYSASMLNPIVYHIFNPAFRNTFHRIMRCNCQKVRLLPQIDSNPYT